MIEELKRALFDFSTIHPLPLTVDGDEDVQYIYNQRDSTVAIAYDDESAARFIAAAVNALPELLAIVEAAENYRCGDVARYQTLVDALDRFNNPPE